MERWITSLAEVYLSRWTGTENTSYGRFVQILVETPSNLPHQTLLGYYVNLSPSWRHELCAGYRAILVADFETDEAQRGHHIFTATLDEMVFHKPPRDDSGEVDSSQVWERGYV